MCGDININYLGKIGVKTNSLLTAGNMIFIESFAAGFQN
jgi:hypothetical protein